MKALKRPIVILDSEIYVSMLEGLLNYSIIDNNENGVLWCLDALMYYWLYL